MKLETRLQGDLEMYEQDVRERIQESAENLIRFIEYKRNAMH